MAKGTPLCLGRNLTSRVESHAKGRKTKFESQTKGRIRKIRKGFQVRNNNDTHQLFRPVFMVPLVVFQYLRQSRRGRCCYLELLKFDCDWH